MGFDHSNGKGTGRLYEKYRCRSCGKYITREELHKEIEKQFRNNPITSEGYSDFIKALDIIWKQEEGQAEQNVNRVKHNIKMLQDSINQQVEAVTNPTNASIKTEIMASIEKKKQDIVDLEGKLFDSTQTENDDKESFLRFAYSFAKNMGSDFLNPDVVSKENRLRCKQLIFPAGFYVDENKKVYTPEISALITLAIKKKDAEASRNSHLVHLTHFHSNTFWGG